MPQPTANRVNLLSFGDSIFTKIIKLNCYLMVCWLSKYLYTKACYYPGGVIGHDKNFMRFSKIQGFVGENSIASNCSRMMMYTYLSGANGDEQMDAFGDGPFSILTSKGSQVFGGWALARYCLTWCCRKVVAPKKHFSVPFPPALSVARKV